MTLKEWLSKNEESLSALRRKKLRWESASAKAKTWVFVVLIFGELLLFFAFAKLYGLLPQSFGGGEKIAVIDFNKPITAEYVKEVMQKLDAIKQDRSFKALLFIVNSPGGSPSGAEEMSAYLKDYNRTLPTYMYIQHIAASGGYYVASAVKPIHANPNSVVGSIGVILPHFSLEKLAQTLGVEEDDLTIGKYKKPISYIKKLTNEQKTYLKQHLLEPTYRNFLQTVANNRGISVQRLKPFAEGKIYIANAPSIQGVLVDKISHLHTLKNLIRDRFGKEVRFVDIMPPARPPLLGGKVDIDLKLGNRSDSSVALPSL